MNHVLAVIKGLGRGGAEQLLVSSIRFSDRTRFQYEVAFLLPWKDALVGDLRDMGVPVHCLQGGRGLGWVPRLRSLAGRDRFDLVHVHSPYVAAAARVALARRMPIVYTEHNMWERYHRATYWANLLTYPLNDRVFAVSDHVRRSASYPGPLRWLRMPQVETLYHGPDPEAIAACSTSDGVRKEFGIPERALVVGTVANLKPHKGHRYLLQAAVAVKARMPAVRFLLVGQGPLDGALRRQVHLLGLEENVIFAGYQEDAVRVANAFDLLALPSLQEGLSIALIEAMALGKPAVVTGVGGLPEVIQHGKQGMIVPAADPRALSEAILALLSDVDLRRRFGRAAMARAAEFDIRKAVHRVEQVYEEVLA